MPDTVTGWANSIECYRTNGVVVRVALDDKAKALQPVHLFIGREDWSRLTWDGKSIDLAELVTRYMASTVDVRVVLFIGDNYGAAEAAEFATVSER